MFLLLENQQKPLAQQFFSKNSQFLQIILNFSKKSKLIPGKKFKKDTCACLRATFSSYKHKVR